MTVMITVVNAIIREVCMYLIKLIGYHTESQEISSIMISIFISTFFNTAILLLLSNANTEGTVLYWIPLRGIYTDLTEDWYLRMGPALVLTMFINSVYAYINFAISWSTKALFRCLDQGFTSYCCCRSKKTTKCVTEQQYVNIYSGPIHQMHSNYGAQITTIFVTFFYGVSLPILFPIAAFSFFNYYITEKFLVTYYFQRPPMYDEKLNKYALWTMKWAPVFFCFFGFWALGNKQIFCNEVNPIQYSNAPVNTGHKGWPYNGPNLPMFIFACLFTFALVFETVWSKCLIKCKLKDPEEPEEVDEKAGIYWQCVKSAFRRKNFAEEVYNFHTLGIKLLGDEATEKMRTFVGNKKIIKAVPNYDILTNQKYISAFQWVPL